MEGVVVGLCAKLDEVGTNGVSMESGCGSAGSLSAGSLLRRDVFCAEEVVGNSALALGRLVGRICCDLASCADVALKLFLRG